MPFVPAPNICMVEWRCTRNAQNIENRLMVNMLNEPTPNVMSDLSVVCWDWWENDHAEHLSVGVNLRAVVVTSLHVENGPQITYAPDTTTTGDLVGVSLPNEVAFCISLRTPSRGRSARGRWYTVSVNQSQMVDDNNLTAQAVGDFPGDLNALMISIGALSFVPSIVSYISNGVPRPGGPVYFPITNCTAVDAGVDSMRRRKPGVGS